jgi:5-methylcytosine-specific restriction endonuclease McrA
MTKRQMPSKKQIKDYWAKQLIAWDKFDSFEEVYEADYCWGCGMEEKTERAHIQSKFNGGSDNVNNLHLLCSLCHKTSEFIEGEQYFNWLKKRDLNLLIYKWAEREGKLLQIYGSNNK